MSVSLLEGGQPVLWHLGFNVLPETHHDWELKHQLPCGPRAAEGTSRRSSLTADLTSICTALLPVYGYSSLLLRHEPTSLDDGVVSASATVSHHAVSLIRPVRQIMRGGAGSWRL